CTFGLGCTGYTTLAESPSVRAASVASARHTASSGAPNDSRRCAVTSTTGRSAARPVSSGGSGGAGLASARRSAAMAGLPGAGRGGALGGKAVGGRVGARTVGGRKGRAGQGVEGAGVPLLGERLADVPGAQPRLDVTDPHAAVKRGLRGGEARGRVALDQHP